MLGTYAAGFPGLQGEEGILAPFEQAHSAPVNTDRQSTKKRDAAEHCATQTNSSTSIIFILKASRSHSFELLGGGGKTIFDTGVDLPIAQR